MTPGRRTRVLVGIATIALVVALAAVFRAYQQPDNVLQWLLLLQLCR